MVPKPPELTTSSHSITTWNSLTSITHFFYTHHEVPSRLCFLPSYGIRSGLVHQQWLVQASYFQQSGLRVEPQCPLFLCMYTLQPVAQD